MREDARIPWGPLRRLAPYARWRRLALCSAVITLTFASANARADIAVNRCSSALLDYSAASIAEHGGQYGRVTDAVSKGYLVRSPKAANPSWWQVEGGDHTSLGTPAPRQGRFLMLDTGPSSEGLVLYSNDFTGLTVGSEYVISVWLASSFVSNAPVVSVELPDAVQPGALLAPAVVPTLPDAVSFTHPDLLWEEVSFRFRATSATQTLQIRETRNNGVSGNDLGIDDLGITEICPPNEPPVAAPMLTGMAVEGERIAGTYAYADAQDDPEDGVAESGSRYRLLRSARSAPEHSPEADAELVQSGPTLGAAGSIGYTLQAEDVDQYLFYCVTPAASAGASPGEEACSAALGPVAPVALPPVQHIVTTVAEAHGTIEPAVPQAVDTGEVLTMTLRPDPGYDIDQVSGCGGTLSGTEYTTAEITADCTVVASFKPKAAPPSPAVTAPVPVLGGWALMGLSAILAGMVAWGQRGRRMH